MADLDSAVDCRCVPEEGVVSKDSLQIKVMEEFVGEELLIFWLGIAKHRLRDNNQEGDEQGSCKNRFNCMPEAAHTITLCSSCFVA